ncbi:MAG: hypothetical protein L0Z70_12855 [Chloroflexi bacterium]|nr:hypothetical protein [Chloroflexota bacterium]
MTTEQELEHTIRDDFRRALWEIFHKYQALTISTNWEVLDKTYGEVGGRFLEDFLLSELKASIENIRKFHIIDAYAPAGRRTMEDVIAIWESSGLPQQQLWTSIKGHKVGSASNPNLVSLKKAKTFYTDHPKNCHFLLVLLHYHPTRIVHDGFTMEIQEIGVYHLKDLHESHFSLQTVGAGGQFLLRDIGNIREAYKTAPEFYGFLCREEVAWLDKKKRR